MIGYKIRLEDYPGKTFIVKNIAFSNKDKTIIWYNVKCLELNTEFIRSKEDLIKIEEQTKLF